ncbi:uncharacterized protein LOC105189153 isoform X2 [Harpegnathos saltator]|uniref:uncharacterized protein LOC105189153 isoform X2 n=1 Tax=Harpegnathos saltator TaxID=610380 RepID=UPI00058FB9B4|nr:uncharacterized protein LOC105189153 isoform X2 [Harpegnathos saltator]
MAQIQMVNTYRGKISSIYYNKFFHPNICHVCKFNGIVKMCNKCYMISYCSEEHKKLHAREHEDICKIIVKSLNANPEWFTRSIPLKDWIESKKKLLNLVKVHLQRELLPYEVQMFMCAKSCFTCQKQIDLLCCTGCYSVNYCVDHVKEYHEYHYINNCKQLALSLNLDIADINFSFDEDIMQKFLNFPDDQKPFDNMLSFFAQYILKVDRRNRSWTHEDYISSDYISGPLTIYNGMKKANLHLDKLIFERPAYTCIIHIIAANIVDRKSLPAWELLLHYLEKTVETLIIIMIGPELQSEFGFQPDFKTGTWSRCLLALQTQRCPLLLTAKSQIEMNENMSEIYEVLKKTEKDLNATFSDLNEYCALRPYRDFDTNNLFFRNEYMLILKNLL